jgi:hypothetical protein
MDVIGGVCCLDEGMGWCRLGAADELEEQTLGQGVDAGVPGGMMSIGRARRRQIEGTTKGAI